MCEENDIFDGYGIRVELVADFNVIKETLKRIGYAPRHPGEDGKRTLYASACILHKRGQYAIMHFKEMFALDGKPTEFNESDEGRRNRIAMLLQEWGLVKILDEIEEDQPVASMKAIKVVSAKERDQWNFVSKYTIGKR